MPAGDECLVCRCRGLAWAGAEERRCECWHLSANQRAARGVKYRGLHQSQSCEVLTWHARSANSNIPFFLQESFSMLHDFLLRECHQCIWSDLNFELCYLFHQFWMLIWLFGILRICVGCIGLSEDWLFAKQTLKFVYVKPINIIDIDSVYIYIFILCILSVFNNPSWLGWLIKIQPTAFCKQKSDLKFQLNSTFLICRWVPNKCWPWCQDNAMEMQCRKR